MRKPKKTEEKPNTNRGTWKALNTFRHTARLRRGKGGGGGTARERLGGGGERARGDYYFVRLPCECNSAPAC